MPKWTDYTIKTTVADNDEIMTLDTAGKANKRLSLSTLSDWVLGKIADKVFAKLQTNDKTILGAINELNSNTFSTRDHIIKSIESVEKTGFYIGNFVKGHNWQIGFALIQQDRAGVFIAIDSIECLLFIGSRGNRNSQWKIKQIS